jgi:NADPH-dependent ferric siderophore reductase
MILEVASREEARPLSPVATCTPTWIYRSEPDGKAFGEQLINEVCRAAREHPNAHWWVACESGVMRRIRQSLTQNFDVPSDRLLTRGYWKQKTENYPDNDYGDDRASGAGHNQSN